MNRAPLILLLLAGCTAPTDYGQPCRLMKRGPTGGAVPIIESEIKVGAGKDFISFGSVDCEDFICVRDTDAPSGTNPNAVAMGYCSNRCQSGSACPSADPADDTNAQKKLRCRALVLDEETLRSVNVADLKSPYFCARGGASDGGTPGN